MTQGWVFAGAFQRGWGPETISSGKCHNSEEGNHVLRCFTGFLIKKFGFLESKLCLIFVAKYVTSHGVAGTSKWVMPDQIGQILRPSGAQRPTSLVLMESVGQA